MHVRDISGYDLALCVGEFDRVGNSFQSFACMPGLILFQSNTIIKCVNMLFKLEQCCLIVDRNSVEGLEA